jgi:sugar phosphate isomerase/epimerase
MYKIGVSSGLYSIARPEELSTTLRKLGYALTRGTSVVELSADVPNEVTETEGEEIRKLAEKQGLEIMFHGSLTVPMEIPERGEWRDAHDHMCKSLRSAVFAGAKYCDFHASLNIWLELVTYAGRKLTMSFCDHEGHFISKILSENDRLRKWFINTRLASYSRDIITTEEYERLREMTRELDAEYDGKIRDINAKMQAGTLSPQDGAKMKEALRDEYSKKASDTEKVFIEKKLRDRGRWESEEFRGVVTVIDGYHIMAHHMFFTKDPIWVAMADIYKGALGRYKMDYAKDDWLDNAWKKAEDDNDRDFKEFFYAVVAAKYLEGHTKAALEWIDNKLVKGEFATKPELAKIAKDITIAIECPDARDPTHGGLHMLWRPRQIYAAVKTIRTTLKTDRIYMLMDFEHVATQGVDPIKDLEETIKIAPDFGQFTLSVHSNAPNPLQPHNPLEMGDVRVYQLLWMLRKTGFGKTKSGYLIFERGGAQDPFRQSVEALRMMVKYLDLDCHPDKLPPEFFGVKGATSGDIRRQSQIIMEHAYEPLKDLLEMPEEEWTMLSQAALRKGKRPEQWKKEEFK